jgi:hypothetical protein
MFVQVCRFCSVDSSYCSAAQLRLGRSQGRSRQARSSRRCRWSGSSTPVHRAAEKGVESLEEVVALPERPPPQECS